MMKALVLGQCHITVINELYNKGNYTASSKLVYLEPMSHGIILCGGCMLKIITIGFYAWIQSGIGNLVHNECSGGCQYC